MVIRDPNATEGMVYMLVHISALIMMTTTPMTPMIATVRIVIRIDASMVSM